MKKYFLSIIILLTLLFTNDFLHAQNIKGEITQLMIDDSLDVNAISMYTSSLRESIFRISTLPEGIVKLDDAQKRSNLSFRNLISIYSKEEQQKIWNLTRYDPLISQIASSKGKRKKIDNILKNYPAEIYDDAIEYAVNHFELIVGIDVVNKNFENEFKTIISNYSTEDQSAFREILKTPEAFSLLNENMHLTVHLGDIYKNNPTLIHQEFDSLSTLLAEKNTLEREEWKQELSKNPDAQNEIRQSANQYAKDNGYSEKDFSDTDPKVIENYVYISYPYWCGYPWWYERNYWYPYPYWYHTGFYIWDGVIVWIGPPSWYFIHWHFHNYHYIYDYPNITNVYINHYYYGHRGAINRSTVEVNHWMLENESNLPRDFKLNKMQRVDRIRELGRSEVDRSKYNLKNPERTINRDDFMKQTKDDYPLLKEPSSEPHNFPKIHGIEEKPIKGQKEIQTEIKPKWEIDKPSKPVQPNRDKLQSKPKIEIPRTKFVKPKPNVHEEEKKIPKK